MEITWTEREAAHLLSRAAFGAGKAEISIAVKLGREETVRRLVAGESLSNRKDSLKPLQELKADGKDLKPDKIADQETYWLYRMVQSDAPLTEKMTLFWHGHFAASNAKVRDAALMASQNELFRKHALGSFHDLLQEIGKDPAMMIWLDENRNKKGKPNENYAREVMELFTLGIGHYTENDVREAARALTGWTIDKETGEAKFVQNQHDDGTKTILGEKGNFDADSFADVLLKQEALPQFMARKLLEFFGDANPSDEWVSRVAVDFAEGPTVGDVLRKLFLSVEFYDSSHRGTIIKTPAEYVAGIVKALDLPLSGGYASAMRKMGQELYLPPDVAGWRGGTSWLTSTNLLARYQFAESAAKRMKSATLDSSDYTPESAGDAQSWIDSFSRNVGLWELSEHTRNALSKYADETLVHTAQKNAGIRGLLQLLLISPEAQMK